MASSFTDPSDNSYNTFKIHSKDNIYTCKYYFYFFVKVMYYNYFFKIVNEVGHREKAFMM